MAELLLALLLAGGAERTSPETHLEEVRRRCFEVLESEFASSKLLDYRIEAGLVLLPYKPRRTPLAIARLLDDVHFSMVFEEQVVDTLAHHLSPALLRYARRTLKRTPPQRWAVRLVSFAPRKADLRDMERYFFSPFADPRMVLFLAPYGRDALPLLERLLHRSEWMSCYAASVITQMGDTLHYQAMEDYGRNNLCLALTFAELEPERARPLVTAHLVSKDSSKRRKAVRMLGFLGDSTYLPLLVELLSDTDEVVALNAAFSLTFFGDTSGAALLRKAAADTTRAETVSWLFSRLPDTLAGAVLHPLLREDLGAASIQAVKAVGALHDSSAVPLLVKLLAQGSAPLQLASLEALGEIGAPQARPHVRPFLDSDSASLRLAALASLGKLRDTAVLTRLNIMLLWEPSRLGDKSRVRRPIVDALVEIGDSACLPALVLALDDRDPYLSMKVLEFLGDFASSDYIGYAEPMLDSPLAAIRIKAAAAIIAMSER